MSNQIFCKVNKEMCDAVKAIAGDRIVVDCGAGRGLLLRCMMVKSYQ